MKKLEKKTLDELASIMPVISETETAQIIGGSGSASGTMYTWAQAESMMDNGTWTGGYVEGMGYVLPEVVVSGSTSTTYSVLQTDDFEGFNASDDKGCLRRCDEMLANGGAERNDQKIIVMTNNNGGRAGTATNNSSTGIDAINNAIQNGKPIIVNVDYKNGTSSADEMGDHFIIISGGKITTNPDGSQTQIYNFFDPATSKLEKGTSSENTLRVVNGRIVGGFGKNTYTVTSVRPNK